MLVDMNDYGTGNIERTRMKASQADPAESTEAVSNNSKRRPDDLTPRELEILRLIWEGQTNRSIAAHLKISMKTADTHRANMMKKLRASNTAQLLKSALERNLLQANDAKAWRSGSQ